MTSSMNNLGSLLFWTVVMITSWYTTTDAANAFICVVLSPMFVWSAMHPVRFIPWQIWVFFTCCNACMFFLYMARVGP